MRIKNVIKFVFSLFFILILILMFLSILDFCGIVKIPEKLNLINLLNEERIIIEVSSKPANDNLQNTSNRVKKIVVQTKNNNEIANEYEYSYKEDYAAIYNGYSYTMQNNVDEFETYDKNLDNENEVLNINEDATKFYYNQLSEYSKRIYDVLYENKEALRTGLFSVDFGLEFDELLHTENGVQELTDAFQLAINALTFDNPEIFFININKMYLLTETITYSYGKIEYKVSVGSNEGISYLNSQFYDKDDVDEAIDEVRSIRNVIIAGANRKDTDKEKIKYVHDYLINNVTYDKTISKNNIYNIYGTLVNKESVCEGYARAFKYILDEMNIPCIIACGTAVNSNGETENHAWNYVKLENRWYAVDVTWDDPIIVGGGTLTDELRYSYFLQGRASFFENHIEDGIIVGDVYSFTYPTLNLANY